MNKRLYYTLAFCLQILLFSGNRILFAQTAPALQEQESNYAAYSDSVKTLSAHIRNLRQQIDENFAKIETLKKHGKLNYLQEQNLEGLLQESQSLSNKMNEAEAKLQRVRGKYVGLGKELIALYSSEITATLQAIEVPGTEMTKKQRHYKLVEGLRKKKTRVELEIGDRKPLGVQMSHIEILPSDSPKKVRQKADLLKDQEDKLRRLASQIKKRHKDLQNELKLRSRMGELVSDLEIFDQQEEFATGSLDKGADAANFGPETTVDYGTARALDASSQTAILVGQKAFDFENLSVDEVEAVMEDLLIQQKRTLTQADSLARQAEIFYRTAENLKRKQ